MGNPHVSWLSPDKYIKDIIWDDLLEASQYAHGSLLDIGCGKKPYKEIFADKIKEHIGIDNNSLEADIKDDFYKTKIRSNSFDTVLLTQVLEHIAYPEVFLKKVRRILKKGGILISTVPFIGSLHEVPTDYYRFTRYGIQKLFESTGFKIIIIREEGNWLSSIGQHLSFYFDLNYNRFGIKYIKQCLQLLMTFLLKLTDLMPKKIKKKELSPLNYVVVAKNAKK